jgi:methionine-rich copper-binding protein CopC
MKRTAAGVVLALFAVAVLTLLGATPAAAHNALVSSTPADKAYVSVGPTTVTLTFNDLVQNIAPLITVTSADGSHWEGSPVSVVDSRASVPVNPLGPAGSYTVSYRIISADGHPVEGTTTFTLSAAGTGTPNPAAPVTGSTSDVPGWVWALGAGIVVLVVVVFTVRGARRRDAD